VECLIRPSPLWFGVCHNNYKEWNVGSVHPHYGVVSVRRQFKVCQENMSILWLLILSTVAY